MATKKESEVTQKELSYIGKVWQTMAIIALFVVGILIIRVAFNVLLMALAGSLMAVYFHGLGDVIQRRTRLGRRWAMVLSIGGSIIILVALFWFMGTKIQVQAAELSNELAAT